MQAEKMKRWVRVLAVLLVLGAALRTYQTRHWPSTHLTPLRGVSLTGQTHALPDQRPVIIHFWATWCGICQAEEKTIEALSKKARVISVASLSGSDARVRDYVQQHRLSYPVIPDSQGKLAHEFGVYLYPTTLFVTRTGYILTREVGYVSPRGLDLRWWLVH
jgi:thiol-disulfide isomerase/thioredoxin